MVTMMSLWWYSMIGCLWWLSYNIPNLVFDLICEQLNFVLTMVIAFLLHYDDIVVGLDGHVIFVLSIWILTKLGYICGPIP